MASAGKRFRLFLDFMVIKIRGKNLPTLSKKQRQDSYVIIVDV